MGNSDVGEAVGVSEGFGVGEFVAVGVRVAVGDGVTDGEGDAVPVRVGASEAGSVVAASTATSSTEAERLMMDKHPVSVSSNVSGMRIARAGIDDIAPPLC